MLTSLSGISNAKTGTPIIDRTPITPRVEGLSEGRDVARESAAQWILLSLSPSCEFAAFDTLSVLTARACVQIQLQRWFIYGVASMVYSLNSRFVSRL